MQSAGGEGENAGTGAGVMSTIEPSEVVKEDAPQSTVSHDRWGELSVRDL